MSISNGESQRLSKLIERIVAFRDERDWKQFHNPKDLAMSLVLEAVEVMEHFQWKSPAEVDEHVRTHKAEIGEELADTLYWVLLMAHDLDIDILQASNEKLAKNVQKYPIKKARGNHTKYSQL